MNNIEKKSTPKPPHTTRTKNSRDDWMTPQYFFDLLDSMFHFTLDPCATEESHKVKKYYTKEDDGLSKNWAMECVFVNPPFNKKSEWIKKCYEEGKKPNTTVVLILPSSTDTKDWHKYIMKADKIMFCIGRVNFKMTKEGLERLKREGKKKTNVGFPLSVIIFKSIEEVKKPEFTTLKHKHLIPKKKH